MFTFTVDMPNGFTVNLDEEKQRNNGAQLVEMDQEKVNVYYDNVSASSDVLHSFHCVPFFFFNTLNCVEAKHFRSRCQSANFTTCCALHCC